MIKKHAVKYVIENNTKENNMKEKITFIVVTLMLTLTACSSKETAEETQTPATVVEEASVEEEIVEETVEVAKPIPVEEVASESTEEVIPEPVVYEGIDMESTLPAGEWTGTFLGIINEPKFVVTNSETNKKVIVEEGQKVVLEEGDVLGVYTNGGGVVGYSGVRVIGVETVGIIYEGIELGAFTEETKFEAKVSSAEGKKFINCILVPNEQ